MTETYKGLNARITLDDKAVAFQHGKLSLVPKPERELTVPLRQIEAVEYTPGRGLRSGVLRIKQQDVPAVNEQKREPRCVEFAAADNDKTRALADRILAAAGLEGESHIETAAEQHENPKSGWAEEGQQLLRDRELNPPFRFDKYKTVGREIRKGMKSWPVPGAIARFETGTPSSRSTATRVAGGALIAGPLGAVAGAAARKDTTKGFIRIQTTTETLVIEAHPAFEKEAREFVEHINRAAVRFAEHD